MYILICCLVFAATHVRPDYPTRMVILSERSELRPVHPGRFCGTKGTHVATQPCSLADPLGSPISFLFTFLQTPLWSPKPQPLSFQSILNSLHKTPGVGVPFRLSSPLSRAQNNASRTTIFLQCRFSFFPIFLFPVSVLSSKFRISQLLCSPLLRKTGGGVLHSSQNANGNAASEARQQNSRNAATQVQPRIRT
jgi:hypothetical protein